MEKGATAESLRLTGDPYEIGTELDRVHRPKTPAALFMLAAAIALSGLAFIVLVSFADDIFAPFITRQCVALLLGTAAMLAAYFSQAKESSGVPVDYCPVKFVKKPAGAKPGMVIYHTYRTVIANPYPDIVVDALNAETKE